ncbi:MAG: N-acetyltransferase [Lachnospiraceae bacterium]|nr:N-acetyltransferase [Lachnospiraceae bacterium]
MNNLQSDNSEALSQILPACFEDIERILAIYDIAKQYMRDSGNPNQWRGTYPDRETLEQDISKKQLYVYKQAGVIHGVFVFFLEEEPTYAYIEGKGWCNDAPYGTIHRIAGDGTIKGLFEKCMEFCKSKIDNIRVDTHHDNHTMQHVVEKYGFQKCGIIYLKNGDPRIAYQYCER